MESIGLLSDTHGPLSDRVLEHFEGVGRIVHAGDIVDASVIPDLKKVAPVIAVRGNMDVNLGTGRGLADKEDFGAGDLRLCVVHDARILTGSLEGIDVILCGHTHVPGVTRDPRGALVVDPGSAGKVGGAGMPRTVARLGIEGREMAIKVISLSGKEILNERHTL